VGSIAARLVGAQRTVERYHCSYGLNPAHLPALVAGGMRFSGHDDDGEARVAELPTHPFYVATLFQPELAGDGSRCHPLVPAFGEAAATGVR
jgi:CTP synthase (UTP-ammonia lyase)